LDISLVAPLAQDFSQPLHRYIDVAFIDFRVAAPYAAHQLRAIEGAAGMRHQELQ
jgi:hypothetical protein